MAKGISNIPALLAVEKNIITNLSRTQLVKNDTWCLIDFKWYKQWKKYVAYDNLETGGGPHPGPIDNSLLLRDDGSGEIKDHLHDELDYVLLPVEGWDLLVKWYGIAEGQQPIARKVQEFGMFVKHCKVEVYLLEFKLCSNTDLQYVVNKKFSRGDTIGFIEQEMRTLFNVPEPKETRLWIRFSDVFRTYEHLDNRESTVQDAGLHPGQILIIEERNDDGTWPRDVKRASKNSGSFSSGSCGNSIYTCNSQMNKVSHTPTSKKGQEQTPITLQASTMVTAENLKELVTSSHFDELTDSSDFDSVSLNGVQGDYLNGSKQKEMTSTEEDAAVETKAYYKALLTNANELHALKKQVAEQKLKFYTNLNNILNTKPKSLNFKL